MEEHPINNNEGRFVSMAGSIQIKKQTRALLQSSEKGSDFILLVEARGVEPLSGRKATKVSPSAADILVSLTGRLSAGFPQLSLFAFPAISPGIKRKPVSLLYDARYWFAG